MDQEKRTLQSLPSHFHRKPHFITASLTAVSLNVQILRIQSLHTGSEPVTVLGGGDREQRQQPNHISSSLFGCLQCTTNRMCIQPVQQKRGSREETSRQKAKQAWSLKYDLQGLECDPETFFLLLASGLFGQIANSRSGSRSMQEEPGTFCYTRRRN